MYQLANPAPVYFDLLGLEPCSGGTLTFYAKGAVGDGTLKNTYSDEEGNTPNANPVQLDSAGRSNTHIWLDGDYTAVLKTAGGVTVWTRDITSGQGAGATIPELDDGEFLTNNGTDLLWAAIRQVPDPTGSGGRILSTDGANLIWIEPQEIPDPPEPDVEIDTTDRVVKIGAGGSTKFVSMSGTGEAPATGQRTTSATINFPESFTAIWDVTITITTDRVSTAESGFVPAQSVTGWTPGSAASSATAFFVLTEDDRSPPNDFNFAVPFSWTAIGTITE